MKRIISFLIILACLFSLISCGDRFYEPVESTEEEARVMFTLTVDGRKYEVRYELYRALFLTHRKSIDGGDVSVWSGANKDEYIEKIEKLIIERATDIYSVFALAYREDIDPYSIEVGKKVNEYINLSVDGGDINGTTYSGYKSYEEYLLALKALNLNYSVQSLLFRYSILLDMLEEHYIGTISDSEIENGIISEGTLKYTRDDVLDFYESDECVRVLRAHISDVLSTSLSKNPDKIRAEMAAAAEAGKENKVIQIIANSSTTPPNEIEAGYVMGKYNLARSYYGEMVDEAFKLDIGEVSPVISVHDGNALVHYILYRTEKNEEHFEDNYATVAYIYLKNIIGEKLFSASEALIESAERGAALEGIIHSEISMD